jgi:tetratricopeptide (TPR) repeat protein
MRAPSSALSAYALNGVGKEVAAIAAAQSALQLREQAQASPDLLARSYVDLCYVESGSGDHVTALAHCERALALIRNSGATADHPVRSALKELEVALVYSGQYDRGLRVARERIAMTAELFGEQSSVLALERLAMTDRLAEAGLFDEADQLIALGMPVILERNGPRSSQYAQALFHVGWLEFLRGRHTQALAPIRQALKIQEQVVDGRDLGMLPVLRTALAQVLIESAQANDEARALLRSSPNAARAMPIPSVWPTPGCPWRNGTRPAARLTPPCRCLIKWLPSATR